jgi:hypothetical protein
VARRRESSMQRPQEQAQHIQCPHRYSVRHPCTSQFWSANINSVGRPIQRQQLSQVHKDQQSH